MYFEMKIFNDGRLFHSESVLKIENGDFIDEDKIILERLKVSFSN